jgi:putative membrane protein insertion efficiency factor
MSLARSAVIRALRLYKILISPLLPAACRFHPSCSEYAAEAVEVHGVPRGLWLSLRRLTRCHPFSKGGFDPVPPPSETTGSKKRFAG